MGDNYDILVIESNREITESFRNYVKGLEVSDYVNIYPEDNVEDACTTLEEKNIDGICSSMSYSLGFEKGSSLSIAEHVAEEYVRDIVGKFPTDVKEDNEYFLASSFMSEENIRIDDKNSYRVFDREVYEKHLEDWLNADGENHISLPVYMAEQKERLETEEEIKKSPFVVCTQRSKRGAKTYPLLLAIRSIVGSDLFSVSTPKYRDAKLRYEEEPKNLDKETVGAYRAIANKIARMEESNGGHQEDANRVRERFGLKIGVTFR